MHSAAWAKLLRHLPAEEHAKLMRVTTSGTEITIQCILRIDPECLALRGRLAGSTEAGRIFFVPYTHIDYLGFQQPLKESEFHDLFANLEMQGGPSRPAPANLPGTSSPTSASLSLGEASGPPPVPRNPGAIKSTVLEKFRSRTTNPGTQIRPPVDE
jgi:hypothetical protein